MADQRGAKPRALTADQVRAFTERAPRCTVRIAVQCQSPGASGLVEAQLVNISTSGMFLASPALLPVGTVVRFKFRLDHDLIPLVGTAEVMRLSESGERGMGLRFTELDPGGQQLLAELIEIASTEPPPVPAETTKSGPAPLGVRPVQHEHGSLRVVLSADTAAYFTYNPLLNIRVGGCFLPAPGDVPIGTGYQLDVVDTDGRLILRCKAKVAAKQEKRIGIRLVDVDRADLLRLRAEIAKLGGSA